MLVPQQPVLGLLLVLLYINDSPQASTFQTLIFADDTFLFKKSNCMCTLQTAVNDKTMQFDDRMVSKKRIYLKLQWN